jgi:hypothetical protein
VSVFEAWKLPTMNCMIPKSIKTRFPTNRTHLVNRNAKNDFMRDFASLLSPSLLKSEPNTYNLKYYLRSPPSPPFISNQTDHYPFDVHDMIDTRYDMELDKYMI